MPVAPTATTFIKVSSDHVPYHNGNPYNCGNPGDPRNMEYPSTPDNIKRVGGADWDIESALRRNYPSQQDQALMDFRAVKATAASTSCSSNSDCSTQPGTVCGTAKLESFERKCGEQIGWWTAKYMCDAVPTFNSTSGIVDCTGPNANLYKCVGDTPIACDHETATATNCCGCVEWLTLTPPVLVVSGRDEAGVPYTRPCGGNRMPPLANPLWVQNIYRQVRTLKEICQTCYTDPFGDGSATYTCRNPKNGKNIVNYLITACPQRPLDFGKLKDFITRLTDYTDGSRHLVFFNNCPLTVVPAITSGNALRKDATADGQVKCKTGVRPAPPAGVTPPPPPPIESECSDGSQCVIPKAGCQPNSLPNLFNICGGSLCDLACNDPKKICVTVPGKDPTCYANNVTAILNEYNNGCGNSEVCGSCHGDDVCVQLRGECFWNNPEPTQGSSYVIPSGEFSTFKIDGTNSLQNNIDGKKGIIWNGKFTFRAGCDEASYKCDIADCESRGEGAHPFECTSGPIPPTTVAEITFNELPDRSDFGDVSLFDGIGYHKNTNLGVCFMPFISGRLTVEVVETP
jgi:hypothetical protein